MSLFYAQVPNGWGQSPSSAGEALLNARQAVGLSSTEMRKVPHYVLEFPDDTEIETNTVWGSFTMSHRPTAIALARNCDGRQLTMLARMLGPETKAEEAVA